MRRILAITLLIAFGSPLVLPALAAQDSQSNLPICCRRNGAHHCTGMIAATSQHAATFTAPPCPAYPSRSTSPTQSATSLLPRLTSAAALLQPFAPLSAHNPAPQRLLLRSHPKRGPPSRLA